MDQPFDLHNISLIVGLGNIGRDYEHTRHNAGFMFVSALARAWDPRLQWSGNSELKAEMLIYKPDSDRKYILARPTTMMNLSGQAVSKLLGYYKLSPEQVLVVHDDLDMNLGEYKLHFAKGPKGHNGIASVEQFLGLPDFWRLRIGIESREVRGNKGVPGEAFALERFREQEREILDQTISNAISDNFATSV